MAAITPTIQAFVLHWGEMGTRWGINRTIAQIHALLYLSPRPLDAGEIAEALSVARSNVSNSLRELQNWGVVRIVHVMGDRRDRYEALKDVWEMFQLIVDVRKRRECDPTLATLREAFRMSRDGVRICTFALTEDYEYLDWVGFVDQLTRTTKGVAFYSAGGDLSECIMESYLSGRRRRTALS